MLNFQIPALGMLPLEWTKRLFSGQTTCMVLHWIFVCTHSNAVQRQISASHTHCDVYEERDQIYWGRVEGDPCCGGFRVHQNCGIWKTCRVITRDMCSGRNFLVFCWLWLVFGVQIWVTGARIGSCSADLPWSAILRWRRHCCCFRGTRRWFVNDSNGGFNQQTYWWNQALEVDFMGYDQNKNDDYVIWCRKLGSSIYHRIKIRIV